MWRRAWLLLLCLCAVESLAQSPGYLRSRNQILVGRKIDWQEWNVADGSTTISETGAVEPRGLRRATNALIDAHIFFQTIAGGDTVRGGLQRAGTSVEQGEFVRDGDLSTGWAPGKQDPLPSWFVDFDLGRSVTAERIVVHFAQEGEGDPFLKFRVMASSGSRLTNPDLDIEFFRVGQVNIRNKDVRRFEFVVKPQRRVPDGLTGEVIQTIRFEALDSDADRAHEISLEQYLELPELDRGATDYFRQTVSGRTILVDHETWEALPVEEQGPIRYYGWEQPRLMEMEVITPGENIVHLTQIEVNRSASAFSDILRFNTTDGLAQTLYPIRPYDPLRDDNQLHIDLGARFWLDRVRFIAEIPLNAYQLLVSDGSIDPLGNPVWRDFEERLNAEQFLQMEERFPLQVVRFIQLRALQLVGTESESGRLREVQAFGSGFVSDIELTSPIIRLPASSMFTRMSWVGDAPLDTRIEIRTRSGDDLEVIRRYFDRFDREIPQDQWESAQASNRGPLVETEIPGPLWSNWSELYQQSGEPFRSPGPRRYTMVNVRLRSSNPERHATIEQLRITLAPPLVSQTFAEIWPTQDVSPGEEEEFQLYLRSQFDSGNVGFDRIRLHSSSSAPLELLSARRGQGRQLELGDGTDMLTSGARVSSFGDAIEIELPAPIASGTDVIELGIRTRLFLAGTTFRVQLFSAERPEVVQEVSAGDAVGHVVSQQLVVTTDLSGSQLLKDLAVDPPVFTPNGDGVNDQVILGFSIFQLRGGARPSASIYDLSGRRIIELVTQALQASGRHEIPWNGRDETGRIVPPGVYVVQVNVDVDAHSRARTTGLVHVAY